MLLFCYQANSAEMLSVYGTRHAVKCTYIQHCKSSIYFEMSSLHAGKTTVDSIIGLWGQRWEVTYPLTGGVEPFLKVWDWGIAVSCLVTKDDVFLTMLSRLVLSNWFELPIYWPCFTTDTLSGTQKPLNQLVSLLRHDSTTCCAAINS